MKSQACLVERFRLLILSLSLTHIEKEQEKFQILIMHQKT